MSALYPHSKTNDQLHDELCQDEGYRAAHEEMLPRVQLIEAVLRARQKRGMSRKALLEATGVPPQWMNRMEEFSPAPAWVAAAVCRELAPEMAAMGYDSSGWLAGSSAERPAPNPRTAGALPPAAGPLRSPVGGLEGIRPDFTEPVKNK